jgi:hypothetical protein
MPAFAKGWQQRTNALYCARSPETAGPTRANHSWIRS